MPPIKTILLALAASILTPAVPVAQSQAQPGAPSAATQIEQMLGRPASISGEVQRFAFPRSDLHVAVDGVRIQPALALGGWLAFRPMPGGAHWEVMGDLVLSQDEVKPVLAALVAGGLTITALHNHLLRGQPFTMYMHVHGHGNPANLARTLKAALALTKTPSAPSGPPAAPTGPQLDRAALEASMGRSGTSAAGGVLQFSIPRAQAILEDGNPIPGPMGMSTAINFQPASEGRVAATGDFVLAADEVEAVVATLTKAGIEVTALHNHMIDEQPRTFFLHFWGLGPAEKVAGGLRAALEQTQSQPPAAK